MLKKIDCVMVRVDDPAAAAAYYAHVFGLRRLWEERTPARTMVGLGFAETDAELVLHTDAGVPHRVEVHYLVDDVAAAAERLHREGCAVVVPPFPIAIGRCAVVRDPFGTTLCILDMTKGPRMTAGAPAAEAMHSEELAVTTPSPVAIDHVAIPTAQPAAMMAFYRDLGFEVPDERLWRGVPNPRLSIVCGDQKINLHTPEEWQDPSFTLRAAVSRPGCGDFCFVWWGSLDALHEALRRAGAAVEAGPVERVGGRDRGHATGTSVYARDPDGNLLEFIAYDAPDPVGQAAAVEAADSGAELDRFTVPLAVTVRASWREDLRELEWFGLFAAHRAWFDETFRRQEDGAALLLVAEASGFPVGQVLVDFTNRAPESIGVLSALRVLPCLQHLGIGARLIGAAERVLRERGIAESEIGACADNPGARRLYERLGYRLVGEQQEPYAYPRPDGTVDRGTFTEWIFHKPLR